MDTNVMLNFICGTLAAIGLHLCSPLPLPKTLSDLFPFCDISPDVSPSYRHRMVIPAAQVVALEASISQSGVRYAALGSLIFPGLLFLSLLLCVRDITSLTMKVTGVMAVYCGRKLHNLSLILEGCAFATERPWNQAREKALNDQVLYLANENVRLTGENKRLTGNNAILTSKNLILQSENTNLRSQNAGLKRSWESLVAIVVFFIQAAFEESSPSITDDDAEQSSTASEDREQVDISSDLLDDECLDPTEASTAESSADPIEEALVEEATDVLSTEDAQAPEPAAPEPSSNPTNGPRVRLPKVNYLPPNAALRQTSSPLAPEVASIEGLPEEIFVNVPGSEPEMASGDRRKLVSKKTSSGALVRFLLPPRVCPLQEHKKKHQYYTCRTLRPHLRSPENLAASAEALIALHGPGFVFDNGVDLPAVLDASAAKASTVSPSSPQDTASTSTSTSMNASAEAASPLRSDIRWDLEDDANFTPEFPWKLDKHAT